MSLLLLVDELFLLVLSLDDGLLLLDLLGEAALRVSRTRLVAELATSSNKISITIVDKLGKVIIGTSERLFSLLGLIGLSDNSLNLVLGLAHHHGHSPVLLDVGDVSGLHESSLVIAEALFGNFW